MALLESQIEGKYEILEKIKEGGMGAVYKVRHRFLDEIRVVKVIRSSLETSEELADRFQREARAAIRLRYPNIAQLHDFAVGSGGVAYIVMEYIDGLTLEDCLRANGRPSLGLSLEIAQQSLKAIGYLHRRGFVHRDIAPDNLMLTRGIEGEPLVKLIDLGIAKVLAGEGNVTSTGMFLGKPRYASPEHFGGDGGVDGRSDVYSFGVVLYELLTGVVPVAGRDPASFMAGHLLRPPLPFEESDPEGRIPDDVRILVLRALAKRSADRFETAEDFGRQLQAIHARFPVGPHDLEEALRPVPIYTQAVAGNSGSTQDRLNAEFNAPTPSPEQVTLPTPPTDASASASAETLSLESPRPGLHHEVTQVRTREGSALPADSMSAPPSSSAQATRIAPRSTAGPRGALRDPEEDWGDQTLLPLTSTRAVVHDPTSRAAEARPETHRTRWLVALVLVAALAGAAWLLRGRFLHGGTAIPEASSPAVAAPGPQASGPAASPAPESAPVSAAQPLAVTPPPAVAAQVKQVAPKSPPVRSPAPEIVPMPPTDPSLLTAGPGVELAEPLSVPEATYPESARAQGLHPHLVVMILVDEKGNVAEARIKIGDNSGLGFNEAALAAAKGARFLPATRNGVPGRSWSELGIDFSPSGQP